MRTEARIPVARSPRLIAWPLAFLLLLLVGALPGFAQAKTNDHFFPAAPAAKSFIDFDSHGFLLHGKRTFIVSASMHYARIPRALWGDRLLRLKRAGFNTVETYAFWNFHESQEGRFDFTGDHDLDAFLKLVKQMGMYAIVRVGPYSCAEWDGGGYPVWLRFKPGLLVREDNAPFEKYVGLYFDKLIPIVAANQINHGGAVIMVQLENEHPLGGGTSEPNAYFRFLHAKALSLGLEVPYFFSGVHHGMDPAGKELSLDDPERPNPWFTTELWSQRNGPGPNDGAGVARAVWKIIARGGSGYNVYMGDGGSNFGYCNNDEDAASYDFGMSIRLAGNLPPIYFRYAVGEGGDLRPIFFRFKRAALFAQSFQDILENSTDANAAYKDASQNSAVLVTARRSPAGTIIFLDNPGTSPISTRLKQAPFASAPFTLEPGEILPVVHDFKLAPGVTLDWAPSRILGVAHQGSWVSLVIYGRPGAPAELSFSTERQATITAGAKALSATSTGVALHAKIPPDGPDEYSFAAAGRHIRILVMSASLADRTWFVPIAGKTSIVVGPRYVGDVDGKGGRLLLTTEQPWDASPATPAIAYTSVAKPMRQIRETLPGAHTMSLALGPWQRGDASQAASPAYDDRAWFASRDPKKMGADGDLTCDAWYRTNVDLPAAGKYVLGFKGGAGDRAIAFVDGRPAGGGNIRSGALELGLGAGKHTLAVFTAHDGRLKLGGYIGEISTEDAKGLNGEAILLKGSTGQLRGWRMFKLKPGANSPQPPANNSHGWIDYKAGDNAFGLGAAWFQTAITVPPAEHHRLHFDTGNNSATIFIGGRRIAHHEEGSPPLFDVDLEGLVKPNTSVTLSLLIDHHPGSGGIWIYNPPSLTSYSGQPVPVRGWRMRGGPGDPFGEEGWLALGAKAQFTGPQFFRTKFAATPASTAAMPSVLGSHPIWRVVTAGLGHGSIWVNGHNLGRYPQTLPLGGVYIPACWLKPGANSLIIYDEEGRSPDRVSVQAERTASRDVREVALE